VTSEQLTAMTLEELKDLGLSLGLSMEGVTSTSQAMGLLLGSAREIVDF
jgi:hypothetical protein